jgi:hypothetical protein
VNNSFFTADKFQIINDNLRMVRLTDDFRDRMAKLMFLP